MCDAEEVCKPANIKFYLLKTVTYSLKNINDKSAVKNIECSKTKKTVKRRNNARGIGTYEEIPFQFSKIHLLFAFIYQYYIYKKCIILKKHSLSLKNCFELSAIKFMLKALSMKLEFCLQCNFIRKICCTRVIICSDVVFVMLRLLSKQ